MFAPIFMHLLHSSVTKCLGQCFISGFITKCSAENGTSFYYWLRAEHTVQSAAAAMAASQRLLNWEIFNFDICCENGVVLFSIQCLPVDSRQIFYRTKANILGVGVCVCGKISNRMNGRYYVSQIDGKFERVHGLRQKNLPASSMRCINTLIICGQ